MRRTTETITLPHIDETAHAITPYRREGTNWVVPKKKNKNNPTEEMEALIPDDMHKPMQHV